MFADIHTHIVFGVDDGAQTFEQTQQMLLRAHENGVTAIAATSHAEPWRRRFPLEAYQEHLRQAQEWCAQQGLPIRLTAGAEVFYTDEAPRLLQEGQIPTLNGTRTVLVEFAPEDSFEQIQRAVRQLGNAGYAAVIAHIERYRCLRKIDNVALLHDELGADLQINASTFIAPNGFMTKRWLRKVMEEGFCDVAATDAHNTGSRPCRMKKCYETLKAEWGTDTAYQLCVARPRQLLGLKDDAR